MVVVVLVYVISCGCSISGRYLIRDGCIMSFGGTGGTSGGENGHPGGIDVASPAPGEAWAHAGGGTRWTDVSAPEPF